MLSVLIHNSLNFHKNNNKITITIIFYFIFHAHYIFTSYFPTAHPLTKLIRDMLSYVSRVVFSFPSELRHTDLHDLRTRSSEYVLKELWSQKLRMCKEQAYLDTFKRNVSDVEHASPHRFQTAITAKC